MRMERHYSLSNKPPRKWGLVLVITFFYSLIDSFVFHYNVKGAFLVASLILHLLLLTCKTEMSWDSSFNYFTSDSR